MMVRLCNACNQKKSVSEFTVSTRHADGVFPVCRSCKNEIKREQERKMKERFKEITAAPEQKEGVVRANILQPKDLGLYVASRDNPTGYQREDRNKEYKSKGTLC